MGLFDFINSMRSKQNTAGKFTQLADGSFWTYYNASNFETPQKLTTTNGFSIAASLAEVYIPIDLIAEKVAKLFGDVYMCNKNGDVVPMPKNLEKIFKRPNPFDRSFTDLAYNFIFSELADGNAYLHIKCLEGAKKVTKDNIQGIYFLDPEKVDIMLKRAESDYFKASTINDYIKSYNYSVTGDHFDPMFIIHSKTGVKNRSASDFKAVSPLMSVTRNINNLLATYSARYNVYVNNGTAYIISPEKPNGSDLNAAINPPDRDAIAGDLNNRFGLTGDRQIKAVSSVPLKGLNTLVTIKDLQPFDECVADMLVIAGVYGVDKDLLPLKEGTTFTNKEVAEAKIWSDIAISYAQDLCADLNTSLNLGENERIMVRVNNVGFLQDNRKKELEADKLMIENLSALQAVGIETKELMTKILNKYEAQG